MGSGPRNAWRAADCDVSKSIDQNEVIVAFTWSWTTTHTFTLKRSLRNDPRVNAQKPLLIMRCLSTSPRIAFLKGIDTRTRQTAETQLTSVI
jgi:hypothetical protein